MKIPSFWSNSLTIEYTNSDGEPDSIWFHWSDVNLIKEWMYVYDYDYNNLKKIVRIQLELISSDHKFNVKKVFLYDISEEIAKFGPHRYETFNNS